MDVVGIRFKEAGKIYYFDTNDIEFAYKDKVIVNTENGQELGEVVLPNFDIDRNKFNKQLNIVLRKANDQDLDKNFNNKLDAKDAIGICQQKADSHNLNMKIVDSSYNFDRSKITFYFIADKRVDFRDLVKDLAASFKSRIELRQIGVRDHAKIIKSHGLCGQQCCCSRHLTDFSPLSIKYAKDQNISLDPNKISGICGRLMCCLAYEQDCYQDMKKIMPKHGQKVKTPDGDGVVINSDYVKEECKVRVYSVENEQNEDKIYELEKISVRKDK
ncbi:stage 0 sporulation family protein [uncultured Anaerococcus sp.]|uniref:PSP1 domain-containing protein n=1 Tax=uncultured Anaerococcus sp. TaxID=293428 RepID=UPI00261A8B2C|nr:stage 0 sporulation family protein [uncultured Anaerococcus sp.]